MQLAALAYADWRALINNLRRVGGSAGRRALWIGYAGVLGLLLWSRFFFARHHAGSGQTDTMRADYFACVLLMLLALALASGPGAIGIFRSRVEARFIIGSPVAAPLAIAYLQCRAALLTGLRLMLSFLYFVFVFGPRRISPVGALADLFLTLATLSAAAAITVPRRLLPRPAAIVCSVVGGILVVVALAPALRDVVMVSAPLVPAPAAAAVLRFVPAWHPGVLLLAPDPRALLGILAVAGGAIALLAVVGRDAYPELYALSIARLDRLERWRSRRDDRSAQTAGRRRGISADLPAPAGVLVFVWKSVVEFRRRSQRVTILGEAALWCVAGFLAARLVALDHDALFTALIGIIVNLMIGIGVTATRELARELRRPLFWLSPTPLFERLCALALARIWRPIATFELVAAGFALGGGAVADSLVFAVGFPAFVALLAGVSFCVFIWFPSAADAVGPALVARLGLSIVLVLPPVVLSGVAAALAGPLAGLAALVLLALIEAGALMGAAAWRLDGRVDQLAA
jgi:hypothetical protein